MLTDHATLLARAADPDSSLTTGPALHHPADGLEAQVIAALLADDSFSDQQLGRRLRCGWTYVRDVRRELTGAGRLKPRGQAPLARAKLLPQPPATPPAPRTPATPRKRPSTRAAGSPPATPAPAARVRPAWQRRASALRSAIHRADDEAERYELRRQLLWTLYTPWREQATSEARAMAKPPARSALAAD